MAFICFCRLLQWLWPLRREYDALCDYTLLFGFALERHVLDYNILRLV